MMDKCSVAYSNMEELAMSDRIMFWAAFLSPIIGVAAIIVSIVIAHNSSKDVQAQVSAINKHVDLFIAAYNPVMLDLKFQFEEQLRRLDIQIGEAEQNLEMVGSPFYGRGARMDDIEEDVEYEKARKDIGELKKTRKMIRDRLSLVDSYLSKAGDKHENEKV